MNEFAETRKQVSGIVRSGGRLRVVLTWQREEKSRRMATIGIRVETPTDFPEKYLRPIERAVNQCSVKKTMLDPPEFVVEAIRS